MEAIGGYFELELRKGDHYHKNAIRLNTARNCFEYILLARRYRKVYIPYYTCEVMLQPLLRHNIMYEFYSINENFEPIETKDLLPYEAFLYTNYFGLKQRYVEKLASIYGSQLIIDNAQAFYSPRLNSIDTFYSPRKFFGVPDGGYLYTDCTLNQVFPQDKSYKRMQHLLQRIDESAESGYSFFRLNDVLLDNNPIRKMSKLTEKILQSIDYEEVMERRIANFKRLHNKLQETNQLKFVLCDDSVPMVYPYLCYTENLKERLLHQKLFIATYWKNVLLWKHNESFERNIVNNCSFLPIDQRYDSEIMNYILKNM